MRYTFLTYTGWLIFIYMHSFKVKIGNILYQKQHLNQLYFSKIKFRKRHLHHSRRFPLCPFTKPPFTPSKKGFSGGTSSKEPSCQCKRHKWDGFNFWVRKIPRRRAWQPSSVFLPGESPWTEEPDGLQSVGLQKVGRDWCDGARTPSKALFRLL